MTRSQAKRPRRRARRSRTFIYSFAGTFLVLAGLFVAVYFYQAPPSYDTASIPSALPSYSSAQWAGYAPSEALSVAFENFSMIRDANASSLPSGPIIEMASPRIELNASDIDFHVVVSLQTPNSTVDVLFLTPATFSLVSETFAGGQSGLVHQSFANFTLFEVQSIGQSGANQSWVALVARDRALLLSEGVAGGQQAVQECLAGLVGQTSLMTDSTSVRQLLYTVGGAEGHYALTIQNFPGKVTTGNMTLISIDPQTGGNVQVTYTVLFPDNSAAIAQVSAVRSDYLNAHQFTVLGPCVRAVQVDPSTSLQDDYRLVG